MTEHETLSIYSFLKSNAHKAPGAAVIVSETGAPLSY